MSLFTLHTTPLHEQRDSIDTIFTALTKPKKGFEKKKKSERNISGSDSICVSTFL